ncbi:MAG TPA: hypothetical protein VEC93_02320 [Anaerolineae bacterium]|nr:hypothetical protein [Anaerolineae bacterium]
MSQREKEKERLKEAMGQMYEELWQWREEHPEATFDEIASQVTPRRRAVMAEVLQALARQHGSGQVPEGQMCPDCEGVMRYKGEPKRGVEHYLEGETALKRAYYYCPACGSGLFPPG